MSERKRQEPVAPDSFETAFQRLEEVVAALEKGGLTLEQSLALFEEGMKLARRCGQQLDAAELRMNELQRQLASQMELIPTEEQGGK